MKIKNYRQATLMPMTHSPGGKGVLKYCRIWEADEFQGPWQFIDRVVLPPGTSIGEHTHGANEEMYIVLGGTGSMTVDGEKRTVVAGDMILNKPYGTHGLVNDSGEELEILVVEIPLPD